MIPEQILKDLEYTDFFIKNNSNESFEDVALLYSIQAFEKSLRVKYYDSYRYIFKIKFSVLIDKFNQEGNLSEEEYSLLKDLKKYRNHQLHLPDENPYQMEHKKTKALMVYNITLKLWNEINI